MEFPIKERYTIEDLREILVILRSENGCPWDREQDHHSIRRDFLEETYEVLEAIDEEDAVLLQEELGDVLLQVVFHARIEEEEKRFDLDDVITGVCKKMILRHPHVFGEVRADTSEQVLKNWDAIKKEEKSQKTDTDTLTSVPKVLPSLMRSEKIFKRAERAGVSCPDQEAAIRLLLKQVTALTEDCSDSCSDKKEEEFGAVLLSLVNLSRFFAVDCEKSLTNAVEKFINRFSEIEKLALTTGKPLKEADSDVWDSLWQNGEGSEK